MSTLYESQAPLHVIEVNLYPNHLAGGDDTYVAKNVKDTTLDIDQVCGSMKIRGGYEGSIEDANKTIRHFLKEVVFLLCDGFSINLGWFTITVGIGGLFNSVTEPFDPKKHKVTFRFHLLKAMREMASQIHIRINGRIEDTAYISEFTDMEDNTGRVFIAGNVCELAGRKIKLEGNPSVIGIWFVSALDPTQRKKVDRIVSNTASKILFVAPNSDYSDNYIEIKTFYSGATNPLHSVRTITSSFTIAKG